MSELILYYLCTNSVIVCFLFYNYSRAQQAHDEEEAQAQQRWNNTVELVLVVVMDTLCAAQIDSPDTVPPYVFRPIARLGDRELWLPTICSRTRTTSALSVVMVTLRAAQRDSPATAPPYEFRAIAKRLWLPAITELV